MKKIFLLFIFSSLFVVNGWAQDFDIYRGTTNRLNYSWDNFVTQWQDSVGGSVVPYEGNSQLVINYNSYGESWGGGIEFNINNWDADILDLSSYSFLVVAWRGTADVTYNQLFVTFRDCLNNSSLYVPISNNSNSNDYQLVVIPKSAFGPSDTLDWTCISSMYLGMNIGNISGTWHIDNIYFTNTPPNPSGFNKIQGKIFDDKNKDCIQQVNEPGLSNYLVKALPGNYYANTNANGEYQLFVDTGSVSYTVQQVFSTVGQELNTQVCPAASHTVNLTGTGQDVCCYNFANEVKQCHKLQVNVGSTRRRRCFRNETYVSYSNYGNLAASGVEIKVTFPEYVVPISSVPAWSSLEGKVATYNIGTLNAYAGGWISITDSVVCYNEAIRNLTQCTEAVISPANGCLTENPSWDRSSIKVEGACIGDSVRFTVANGGSDMQGNSAYRVFINDTLIYTGAFILKSHEAFHVTVLTGGNTVRLEADQRPFHPGYSRPRETIEACGGNMATAARFFVSTTAQDDQDEFVSISCLPIIDSYDPNDKLAVPAGYLEDHFIKTTTEKIDYTIRFQNTGSDTAFTVVITDTLDVNLDISTLQIGAASHDFTWKLAGIDATHLTFRFDNILLPDSTTDNPGSNGFIKFSISPVQGLPEGELISNKAEIFFDYNSAVVTNTYIHTLSDQEFENDKSFLVKQGEIFLSINAGTVSLPVEVYPNPASNILHIKQNTIEPCTFTLFTFEGKKVFEKVIAGSSSSIDISTLEQGIYFYEIKSPSGNPVNGRVVKL